MAFNEKLTDKIREAIEHIPNVEEKQMFGGVCFMVEDKLCLGVFDDEMLCRIDPVMDAEVLELTGIRPMDSSGKSMKGFILVCDEAMKTRREFDYWIGLSLEYNPRAIASRKKKKKLSHSTNIPKRKSS